MGSLTEDTAVDHFAMPSTELGRRFAFMGHGGKGTSFLVDEIIGVAREGTYAVYCTTAERNRDPLFVTITALGQQALFGKRASSVLPFVATESQATNVPARSDLRGVRLSVQPPSVDLGAIPTVVEPEAERLLARLPGDAVRALLRTVGHWIAAHPEVARVRVLSVTEPEDIGWTEVVVQVRVEADTPSALSMWDDLASRLDVTKDSFGDADRARLDSALAVHLVWNDNDEDEEDGP